MSAPYPLERLHQAIVNHSPCCGAWLSFARVNVAEPRMVQ